MKKKLLALALSAAMTLSLAACGDSGTPAASGSGSAGSDGQTFTVGVCQLAQHPALDAATQGFVDALKAEFGDAVDVQVQNAGGEVTNCSTIINGFVSNSVDLILANATSPLTTAASATSDIPILGPSVTQAACDASDVIYVPTDNKAAENTEAIANVVLPAGVPVIAGEQGICSGCGVATLSIDYYELGTITGQMAVKILKGEADISTMAVESAPNVTKMYNAANCEALNITVPEDYSPIEG